MQLYAYDKEILLEKLRTNVLDYKALQCPEQCKNLL